MSRTQFFRSLLACLSLLAAIPAGAQIFRAYLSSTGNDSNPCTLPAPCRLLPAAVNAVASGGDIWMLDPANYNTGTVTITKAVNIRSMPGVVASLVSVSGQPAVLVSAAVAVGFRGVSFGFLPGGAIGNGIQTAVDGATLVVDDCEFSGLSRGVEAGGPGTAVSITDSRFRSTGAVIYSSARDDFAIPLHGRRQRDGDHLPDVRRRQYPGDRGR